MKPEKPKKQTGSLFSLDNYREEPEAEQSGITHLMMSAFMSKNSHSVTYKFFFCHCRFVLVRKWLAIAKSAFSFTLNKLKEKKN